MATTSTYRYFIYSSEQMEFQKKMEEKAGRNYQVGTVIASGKKRPFTELSKTGESNYSDAKIIAEGEIKKFKYTLPKGVK
jgi:hypothetical protein